MPASRLALGLALALLVSIGCSDNTPNCVPQVKASDCFCADGNRGQRTCKADGLSYGECVCSGTGGAPDGGSSGAPDMPAETTSPGAAPATE